MDGRQISLHNSNIVSRLTDKSAELINNAGHEWPIKRPPDYQPWEKSAAVVMNTNFSTCVCTI